MLVDESFSVDKMLEESCEVMLTYVGTSIANIPANTINWYEMKLLDEMEPYSTDVCRNDVDHDSILQEKFEETKDSCEVINRQCKDQKEEMLRLTKENEALKKIWRLEIFLTRRDEQTCHLWEKLDHVSLTFDKLNKCKKVHLVKFYPFPIHMVEV